MSQYDNTTNTRKYNASQIKYQGTAISGWRTTSPIKYAGTAVPRMQYTNINLLHRASVYNGKRMRHAEDAWWSYLHSLSPTREDVLDESAAYAYRTTNCRYTLTYDSTFTRTWSSPHSSTRQYESGWTAGDYMPGFDDDRCGSLGAYFHIFKMTRVDNTGGASLLPETMYYTIMWANMSAIDRLNGKYYTCDTIADWLASGAARPTASEWNNSFGSYHSVSSKVYWNGAFFFTFTTRRKPNFTNSNIPEKFTCAQVNTVIYAAYPIYSLKYRLHYASNSVNVAEVSVAGSDDLTNFFTVDKSITCDKFSACVQERGNKQQYNNAILPGMAYSACLQWRTTVINSTHWQVSSDSFNAPIGSSCDYSDDGYGATDYTDVNYSFKFTDGSTTLDIVIANSSCYLYEFLNGKTVQLQWDRTGWGTLAPAGYVYVEETDTDCINNMEY